MQITCTEPGGKSSWVVLCVAFAQLILWEIENARQIRKARKEVCSYSSTRCLVEEIQSDGSYACLRVGEEIMHLVIAEVMFASDIGGRV